MAYTEVITGNIINISAIGSDYDLAVAQPHLVNNHDEVRLKFVAFEGNAADVLKIRNGAADAAVICNIFLTAEQRYGCIVFDGPGILCKPYIDFTDLTVAGTELIILHLG